MAAQAAGAFAMVVECVPVEVARRVTEQLAIPTIGIGAGPHCDGQVLVVNDMLGLTSGYVPSFVKSYADVGTTVDTAVREWCDEVRGGSFPGSEHSFDQ